MATLNNMQSLICDVFQNYLSPLEGSLSCDLSASEPCKIIKNQIEQDVETSRKIKALDFSGHPGCLRCIA